MDITKDYSKYRTLFALTEESIVEYEREYERLMQPDPINGTDVHAVINISEKEALLGIQKELEVTIEGTTKRILVNVPAGIESGKYIRYREKGELGKYGGHNGDLYVRVVVKKEETGSTNENTLSTNITFLEAVKGTEKEVILPEKIICKKCKGTGRLKETSCPLCDGNGKMNAPKKIRVKIPAGIDEGQMLHLKKNAQVNKLSHDWYVKVSIDKHPKFERKGYDIYSTEILPFYIGASRNVAVDTLDGKQYCTITKEIKEGSQTCLKGQGIGHINNPSVRGNHYVTWKKK